LLTIDTYAQAPINKLWVNNSIIDSKGLKKVNLNANDNDFILELRSIQGDSVRYFFQLQNYDHKWIESKYPTIRYTNLSGGSYVLTWKTKNKNDFSPIAKIEIEVEKSLTEEWWFMPSVIFYFVLVISAAIYFFLLYNLRQKVKLQAIRNRIAADLHDEVGSTLNSISIFSRLAEKKLNSNNVEVLQLLDKIKSDSDETVHTIRDTVWAINPDNDSIAQLFEKMRSMAYQLLTAKGITLDFEQQFDEKRAIKISMEQRRNVYLIFKEAINNILKHADASYVKIRINSTSNDITLQVEDNGKGFDTQTNFEGNGLKNYQKRAKEGFLDVTLSSEKSKGTNLIVVVPAI
jgi:signal transduction histidine kinase